MAWRSCRVPPGLLEPGQCGADRHWSLPASPSSDSLALNVPPNLQSIASQMKCKLFMNKDHTFCLFEPLEHLSTFHTVLIPSTYLCVDKFGTDVILNLWLLWVACGLTLQDTEESSARNTKKEDYVGKKEEYTEARPKFIYPQKISHLWSCLSAHASSQK